jgi:Asp-tRNA(Asn)/Glu-tRNA(Gln) amidotransferase A subunit family amidase
MIEDRDTRPIARAALTAEARDLLGTIDLLEEHFTHEEPPIRAFVPEEERFARLRLDVEELFTRFPAAEERPPLFGVPIGIKDIFHVDGLPTHAGSKLPVEELAGDEADCVTALKRAGALVLGKTVTTEFAYFAPGPTRNPRHLDHTPGGSSSGSAARDRPPTAASSASSRATTGSRARGSYRSPPRSTTSGSWRPMSSLPPASPGCSAAIGREMMSVPGRRPPVVNRCWVSPRGPI